MAVITKPIAALPTRRGKLLQVHVETTDYEIRVEEIQNKEYWIVPVVMMVEGVHNGSRGPILYTEEELANSIGHWSGVPVTIGHPQDEEGKYISANEVDSLEAIVGKIFNPKMVNSKLTAEAWIEINTLKDISEEAFEYIKEKKALDVSVGVYSKEVGGRGEFEGEEYRAEAVNITPDHLALLPGETGACSWSDGCGIRTNAKNKMKTNTKQKNAKEFDKAAWLATLLEKNDHLIANEASFGDIIRNLHDQIGKTDNDARYSYVEEVFDDYFVYCTVNRSTGERALYKREYEVSEDGKVKLTGLATEVRKEVSFVAMKLNRTKFSNNNKPKQTMNKKKCTCTVDSLIQNKATNFTEDDREWLAAMSQEQLDKLAPKEEAEEEEVEPVVNKKPVKKVVVVNKEDAEPLVQTKDGKILINGKGIEEYVKESLAGESDPVKFIDNFMPEGVKGQMKAGLKMYQDRRAKQIKDIAANSKFKEEQLKNWADEDLAALHETVLEGQDEEQGGGNYAPLAGGSSETSSNEDDAEAISAMMSFNTPKEKKEDTTAKK